MDPNDQIPRDFDHYYKWLGIPRKDQPPNYYRLLGVELFESDPDVISNAADQRMLVIRTYQSGSYADLSQQLLNELAAARLCLLDPQKKASYDGQLGSQLSSPLPHEADAASVRPIPIAVPPPPTIQPTAPSLSTSTTPSRAIRTSEARRRRKKVNIIGHLIAPVVGLTLGYLVLLGLGIDPLGVLSDKEVVENFLPEVPKAAERTDGDMNREWARGRQPVAGESQELANRSEPGAADQRTGAGSERPAGSTSTSSDEADRGEIPADSAWPSWAEGAVLAFSFDEDARFEKDGTPHIRDLSGTGNHGEVHDATFGPGITGEGLLVGGREQFVQCATVETLNSPQSLSVAAWIRAHSWAQRWFGGVIVDTTHWKGRSFKGGYVLRTGGSGSVEWTLASANAWSDVRVDDNLQTGRWHHVVGTYDGQYQRLFIDGVERGSKASPQGVTPSSYPLQIGSGTYAPDRYFTGQIDEVAVWKRALSADEVQALSAYRGAGRSYCRTIAAAQSDQVLAGDPAPDTKSDDGPGSDGPLPLDSADRLPIPSGEAVEQAERLLEESFGSQIQDARQPADQEQLANRLLSTALETQDAPNERYVVLSTARDLAMQAGSGKLAFDAIDRLAQQFQVDPLAQKAEVLERMARSRTREADVAIWSVVLQLSNEAIAAEQYDEAERFLAVAQSTASRMASAEARNYVTRNKTEFRQIKKAYEAARPALDTLLDNPNDPHANTVAGRYYCFALEQWDRGLSLLARGAEGTLRDLAVRELQQPLDAAVQARLGESWVQAAENLAAEQRPAALRRASHWYRMASGRLSGLEQLRVSEAIKKLGIYNLSGEQLARTGTLRDKTYLYMAQPMSWDEAQQWAAERGGNLVCIGNRLENEFIARYVLFCGTQQAIYIGGLQQEGQWRWVDGSDWKFTSWPPGQTTKAGGRENVLVQLFYSKSPLAWKDAPSTTKRPFVVQWVSPP